MILSSWERWRLGSPKPAHKRDPQLGRGDLMPDPSTDAVIDNGQASASVATTRQPESGQGKTPAKPDADTSAEAGDDAIYDAAAEQFLNGDQSDDSDTGLTEDDYPWSDDDDVDVDDDQGDDGKSEADAGDAGQAAESLTDDQLQLLRRLHMTPEMVKGWTDEQRKEFFSNSSKRESDQTTSFKEMREEVKRLRDMIEGKGNDDAGDTQDGSDGSQNQSQESPGDQFEAEAIKATNNAVEIFGDEIKPLGDVTVKLGRQVDRLVTSLESAQSHNSQLGSLLVDSVIDSGIRDLEVDFPSLSKAEARSKVADRFKREWSNEANPHRNGEGSLLARVRSALKDAAKAEFGNVTESAAQLALSEKTKKRLKQQPTPGHGRGRQVAITVDDIYDQEFNKHLKPNM